MYTHEQKVMKNNPHPTASNDAALHHSNAYTAISQFPSFSALTGNSSTIQQLAIIQRDPTPAENLIIQNPSYPVDDDYALIGSDNAYSSPLCEELQRCIDQHMMMPHTLSRLIQQSGKNWSQEINNAWINDMIKSKKIFVIVHLRIIDLLNKNRFNQEYQKRFSKKEPTGTWLEVKTLRDSGYTWDSKNELFFPQGLAYKTFDAWFEANYH